jgi:hypothetical protein
VYGGEAGEFDARGDVELGEGMPEMVADSVLGQEQPPGNLPVRQPSGDLPHDFELAVGQPWPAVSRRDHPGEAAAGGLAPLISDLCDHIFHRQISVPPAVVIVLTRHLPSALA